MAETVTLTSPITKPSITGLSLVRVLIDVEAKSLYIEWRHSDGTLGSAAYPTPAPSDHASQPTGAQLLNALNTANLSTVSLVKRIYNRLITDGYVTGTVSGTPD